MQIALKIASEGYYNGSPEKVLHAPIDIILDLNEYIDFRSDYQNAFYELNKEEE